MLNHSITRFNDKQKVRYRNSFVNRYIFPDGELTGPAKVMMAATMRTGKFSTRRTSAFTMQRRCTAGG